MMWHIAYANILQKQILAIAGLLDPECIVQKMKGTVSRHVWKKSLYLQKSRPCLVENLS